VEPLICIDKAVGRLELGFSWTSKKNLWGRFGGGWNWKLGFQSGGRTLILNLLVFSLRFTINERRKTESSPDGKSETGSRC